jgi:ABC-2 type transport system ATP-binding protein
MAGGRADKGQQQRSKMLEIENLRKTFGGTAVLDDFNLSVPEQSIFALVGPNGAGKTTALKTIMGVHRPDAGSIRYRGETVYDSEAVKQEVVFIPDNLDFYNGFNLKELGRLYRRI